MSPSAGRRVRGGLNLLVISLLLSACTQDLDNSIGRFFSDPVTTKVEPEYLPDLQDSIQTYRYPDLDNPDGTITRVLWFAPGIPRSLNDLLQNHPDWKAATPTLLSAQGGTVQPLFFKDPNVGVSNPTWKEGMGVEPIMLRGAKNAIEVATSLAHHLVTSVPQISIEARVVEVLETDEFGFGTEWFFLEAEDHPFSPSMPNAPLDRTDTIFDRSRTGRGIPALPGLSAGFVPNVLTSLGTIQDDIQIDLLISALKAFTKVDVVNAPNVAVLSGHTASITAGQDIPYFELNVVGVTTVVSTRFKKVGVSLDVLPFLVKTDTIRMAVQVKVDNVTGVATLRTAGTETANPIIASRGVTTTMDVKDGATVVLGGLITTGKIGTEEKVPVLGEIPLLDILFSSRHSQDSRSNLIFFIRPKIITPAGTRGTPIIVPPGEGTSRSSSEKPTQDGK